jgi:murein DD-endopeptidase MepM/ murein hydrolase activator NlpD
MPMLVLLLISLGLLAPSRASYAWPITPARVVRAFDPPASPWLPGHRGVDLAGVPGAVVRAAGSGRVVYAGVLAGRGVVSVQHPDGLRTTYEPVTPSVVVGDMVGLGSSLGELEPGHPGCPAEACLHWGLRHGDLYLDPLALLGLGRVRLLPLQGSPAQFSEPESPAALASPAALVSTAAPAWPRLPHAFVADRRCQCW